MLIYKSSISDLIKNKKLFHHSVKLFFKGCIIMTMSTYITSLDIIEDIISTPDEKDFFFIIKH